MLFLSAILAVMAATSASAAGGWSSTTSSTKTTTSVHYGYTIQPACPLQVQPNGRYTYNSSNPFPYSSNSTVSSSASTSSSSSLSSPVTTTATTTTGSTTATSTKTGGPEAFTGAASRQNVDVMGAMGGIGLFAAAVALL